MSRPIEERVKYWRWWGEQIAHLLIGFAIAVAVDLPLMWTSLPHPVTLALGMVTSLAACIGREAWQNWGDVERSEDMLFDVGFWMLGASLAPLTRLVVG